MIIHLIRDKGFKEVIYNEVFEILNNSTGELKFKKWDNELDIISPKSHQDYFNVCNSFREENELNDDIVLFLSSTSLNNYFSLPDFSNNIYVKVSGWEDFVESQIRFPIAIEIVTNIFHLLMFDSLEDLEKKTHLHENRGCINDYTLNLKDVNLKMKTPDLCDDCLKLLINPKIISYNVVEQIFEIADKSSIELRKVKRYLSTFDTLEMEVKNDSTDLYFQTPVNHTLHLPPIEFALYKLLLIHNEGVIAQNIFNVRNELFEIYFSSGITKKDREASKLAVDSLCFNASVPVSKINKKLSKSLPSSIAKQYKIQNINGSYIVAVNRNLVIGI
jgi:hypothetical protein